MLNQADFKNNFDSFLDSIDEPFADSSAFAVYLLSQKTKEYVTVALSGDGADEVFGGYRKYYGEWVLRNSSGPKKGVIKTAAKFGQVLPSNRSTKLGDINRKLQKLSKGYNSNANERYWDWGAFIKKEDRDDLFVKHSPFDWSLTQIIKTESISDLLIADQNYVLPNDMLTKVDMMSMANTLEVRTPFLDHNLVDFVNDLPDDFKVNKNGRKQILTDAFKSKLPKSVWDRQKKGFEIPLKSWIGDNIDVVLESEIFSIEYIKQQGLFDYEFIVLLKKNWNNPKFGDKIYLVWTLVIFQNWWNKYLK
jgi:asparagine synthase (glutamine-hydrolysing)